MCDDDSAAEEKVKWLIMEDGHRLDVCSLKTGKQRVAVWDVEPATGKIEILMVVSDRTRETRADSRSHARMGYKIESRTSMRSGESRGSGP
jgi:hypothetical protein